MNLLEFLMKKIVYPLPPEGEAARAGQLADRKRLEQLQEELDRARADWPPPGSRRRRPWPPSGSGSKRSSARS